MRWTSWKKAGRMIGLDTGFFVELLRGRAGPLRIWQRLIDRKDEAVCSAISLYELERLALRGALDRSAAEKLQEVLPVICRVRWIDDADLLSRAAGIGYGIGLPAVDAMILASLLDAGATQIHTTNADFERFTQPGFEIANLRQPGR